MSVMPRLWKPRLGGGMGLQWRGSELGTFTLLNKGLSAYSGTGELS